MNEGSGGRGEIPRQDSNVTGKDMKRRFIISSEGKVEGWMAFKLVASSSRLSLCSRTHKEITGGRYSRYSGDVKLLTHYKDNETKQVEPTAAQCENILHRQHTRRILSVI